MQLLPEIRMDPPLRRRVTALCDEYEQVSLVPEGPFVRANLEEWDEAIVTIIAALDSNGPPPTVTGWDGWSRWVPKVPRGAVP